jgi:carboxymethylenebutenolidase
MGEMIQFQRPDGQTAPAYLATPAQAARAGVVVIQEWWGLSPQILRLADRLATEGFQVLLPDLYRGKLTTDPQQAQNLMTHLNWGDATSQDIQGAIQHLGQASMPVAVIGFCMGGALTLMAAATLTGLEAAVCFYGIPPADAVDLTQIKIPLLAHFAIHDDWCTPARVDDLEATLQKGQVVYQLYRYDAQHAFMNEDRAEVHNPEAAAEAWQRTLAFLNTQLKVR